MSQEIEIEFKSLITEADYLRLITEYQSDEQAFFTQTNVYFDTPNFELKERGMGLRIRLRAEQAELTLKSPLENQEGLLETTDLLSLTAAESLIAQKTIFLEGEVAQKLLQSGISLEALTVQAHLKTKRAELQLTPDTLLVLDESWYHGHHDYELEMEVRSAEVGKAFFVNFLKEKAIDYTFAKNKVERAFSKNMSI